MVDEGADAILKTSPTWPGHRGPWQVCIGFCLGASKEPKAGGDGNGDAQKRMVSEMNYAPFQNWLEVNRIRRI